MKEVHVQSSARFTIEFENANDIINLDEMQNKTTLDNGALHRAAELY